ncbi:unnamed protein product [Phaedon cochleariae]|uniref:Uncharacterized protein n=1 Tax=Phaedon cochleariae TaxID=80249 RepID=A0A9N9X207_PHACE|nr:unnamed protein product [Phaedon cochleariae]
MDARISLVGYNLQLKDIRHSDQGDYTCQIGDGTQGDLIHRIEILNSHLPSPQKLSGIHFQADQTGGHVGGAIMNSFLRKCHQNYINLQNSNLGKVSI